MMKARGATALCPTDVRPADAPASGRPPHGAAVSTRTNPTAVRPVPTDPAPNEFLASCGARAPFRLDVRRGLEPGPTVRTFDLPFAVIGWGPGADLRLEGAEVGRRH